jgi:hypothetical protein
LFLIPVEKGVEKDVYMHTMASHTTFSIITTTNVQSHVHSSDDVMYLSFSPTVKAISNTSAGMFTFIFLKGRKYIG